MGEGGRRIGFYPVHNIHLIYLCYQLFVEKKMSKIYDWFEERLEIQAIADDITSVRFVSD